MKQSKYSFAEGEAILCIADDAGHHLPGTILRIAQIGFGSKPRANYHPPTEQYSWFFISSGHGLWEEEISPLNKLSKILWAKELQTAK